MLIDWSFDYLFIKFIYNSHMHKMYVYMKLSYSVGGVQMYDPKVVGSNPQWCQLICRGYILEQDA